MPTRKVSDERQSNKQSHTGHLPDLLSLGATRDVRRMLLDADTPEPRFLRRPRAEKQEMGLQAARD